MVENTLIKPGDEKRNMNKSENDFIINNITAKDQPIYNYDINKVLNKEEQYDEGIHSCLTTTITTNEFSDSNCLNGEIGIMNVDQLHDCGNCNDFSAEIEKNKNQDNKVQLPTLLDENNKNINNTCNTINNKITPPIQEKGTTKGTKRGTSININVGPRQLKYNQIGVYWKDRESRVYARFTWATRKYSKSFYVGPNKQFATVRDAEKAAIRFLLINSPLHRRSHLKHFRFTESDDEGNEPYVGTQYLKEARKTKGIMLHFPAPESDDEVWTHYNTSNINPATLYGEIIKKMDNNKTLNDFSLQNTYDENKNKGNKTSADDMLPTFIDHANDGDRVVERVSNAFINPNSSSIPSAKKFKTSKCDTSDTLDTNLTSSPQFTSNFVDNNISSFPPNLWSNGAFDPNLFGTIDYNALALLQQVQLTNYYIQHQALCNAAMNIAVNQGGINPGNIINNVLNSNKVNLGFNTTGNINGINNIICIDNNENQHTVNIGHEERKNENIDDNVTNLEQETNSTLSSNISVSGSSIMQPDTTFNGIYSSQIGGWCSNPYNYGGASLLGTMPTIIPGLMPTIPYQVSQNNQFLNNSFNQNLAASLFNIKQINEQGDFLKR